MGFGAGFFLQKASHVMSASDGSGNRRTSARFVSVIAGASFPSVEVLSERDLIVAGLW